jgi:RNA polymerase sigma-70 factor (ECF subfamily)
MMNAVVETSVYISYLSEFTDEELVGEYRIFGDYRYFEELMRRYRPSLARFLKGRYNLCSDQVEEALQATFARLWQKLDQFDISRQFRPWIYRIASTQTIDLLREYNRHNAVLSLDAPTSWKDDQKTWASEFEGREIDPQLEMERLDVEREVRNAVAQLPQKFRQVLELVFFQGLTQQSVANALDLTVSTVSRRIKCALKQLSLYLLNDGLEIYHERSASLIGADAA